MIILQFFVNSADATKVNLSQTFEPISWTHLLGTDDYGRDLFTRVIVGARSTLFITILTLIAIVIIGVTLGLLAGYKKGWIERIILRIVDIGLSIPEFIIMIALASFFQPSIWNLVIAITIIKWMNYTRLTRSIVNSEITKPYIKMAKLFHVPVWIHRNLVTTVFIGFGFPNGSLNYILSKILVVFLSSSLNFSSNK